MPCILPIPVFPCEPMELPECIEPPVSDEPVCCCIPTNDEFCELPIDEPIPGTRPLTLGFRVAFALERADEMFQFMLGLDALGMLDERALGSALAGGKAVAGPSTRWSSSPCAIA